eukprot:GHVN01073708.1.p1 GENE.GHVN01073708.1~~GHVN01073708.1.p1  ORF type:complete len:233 (-),score=51.68 GHVN01073708.1:1835-2533(-)
MNSLSVSTLIQYIIHHLKRFVSIFTLVNSSITSSPHQLLLSLALSALPHSAKLQAESMSSKRRPRDVEVVSDFDFGPSSLECTPEIGQPFKSNAVSYPQIDEFELQVSIEPSCEPEQPPHSPDSPFLLPQSSPTHTLPTSPPTAVTRDSLSSHISTQSTTSSSSIPQQHIDCSLAQANHSELDINFPVRRRRRPGAKSRRLKNARGGAAGGEIDHGGEGDSLETLHSPHSSK